MPAPQSQLLLAWVSSPSALIFLSPSLWPGHEGLLHSLGTAPKKSGKVSDGQLKSVGQLLAIIELVGHEQLHRGVVCPELSTSKVAPASLGHPQWE